MGTGLRILRNTLLGAGAGIGALYVWDQTFNRRAFSRTGYALYNALVIGIDYKLNFRDGKDIEALHERNAGRLYNVITKNKGLYVKMGQAVAIQGNMLPGPYKILLSKLYDDAPQDTWEECLHTLKSGLGRDPMEIFSDIDHRAVASASIAQVHKATLRETGENVAVKIQHADIEVSTKWDLNTYKMLMWVFEKFVFNMPMYFVAKYIADQVCEETDFVTELKNAQTMRNLVESDPDTRRKVYVPKLYPELSSKRVLVMEWIDGTSLSRKDEVISSGFNVKSALTDVFKILTKEAFEWGVIHSDPHPGNWILRWNPQSPKQQQLVMLDHGLYVYMSEKLRTQYLQLWRAMFDKNLPEISRITQEWGFGDPKVFASATMLQPYDDDNTLRKRNNFEEQEFRAERLRNFLKDTTKMPLSLVFVGRTQRILQGLNQLYGSPVNRMRLLVEEALTVQPGSNDRRAASTSKFPYLADLSGWLYKRFLLLSADLIFLFLRVKQSITKEDPEAALEQTIQQNSSSILK